MVVAVSEVLMGLVALGFNDRSPTELILGMNSSSRGERQSTRDVMALFCSDVWNIVRKHLTKKIVRPIVWLENLF